jgi:ribosomal-protein-alanine N-acetyltransferase
VSAVLKDELLEIRPMRDTDLPMVLDIEREAYAFPWSEGIFRDCLRAGYCCWVVEREALVRAYGIMQVGAGESHILNLCVRASGRGQGLGRALLSHLLEVATEHRADTALLEVRPTNRAALGLYEVMGFNEVGVRRGYYPGRDGREDALILATCLSNGMHANGQKKPRLKTSGVPLGTCHETKIK